MRNTHSSRGLTGAFCRAIVAACGLAVVPLASADVRPAGVIGSNMVLQQSSTVPIWGWADPGEEVTVSASWAKTKEPLKAKADASGKWLVKLATPSAREMKDPGRIVISGKNSVVCDNVAIGEVWLCSGQSNMEWTVAASNDAAKEIASANNPRIRYFATANEVSVGPREDCKAQFGDGWRVVSPKTAGDCTAVGYFFARELEAKLGVPVGLVQSDWGGTPIEAWTPEAKLLELREYQDYYKEVDALDSDPMKREQQLAERTSAWWDAVDQHPKSPGANWATPGFNDSSWHEMDVPSIWAAELAEFDGFMYMRHTFEASAGIAGKAGMVELGPIDDRDDVYINGKLVGSGHGPWMAAVPRSYAVPEGVIKEGTNVIAVRLRDDQGAGGIGGEAVRCVLRSGDVVTPLAGKWKFVVGPSTKDLAMPGLVSGIGPSLPSSLYNAMIYPVKGYGIRGFLWYQGESNRGRADQYAKVFPGMIQAWRKDWESPHMPFYFVQIAPYNYGNDPGITAELRDAQTGALKIGDTGMVCTMDIGDVKDIHPRNKQEVGRRLALQALSKTYGKTDVLCDGPMYKSTRVEGNTLVVLFDIKRSKGLKSRGGDLTYFQVAGQDRIFYRAIATIDGADKVRVHSDHVGSPTEVRFGWEGTCEPNLCNMEGLPAVPFRTDTWPTKNGGWPAPKE